MNVKKILSSVIAFAIIGTASNVLTYGDKDIIKNASDLELVSATLNPYYNNYNIIDTVNYAMNWYNSSNPNYAYINDWAYPNCASFVSECLTAGGFNFPKASRTKIYGNKYIYKNTSWSVANDQFKYFIKLGYTEEIASTENIHIGDLVYYDWNADGRIDHSSICIGLDSDKNPIIAQHTNDKVRKWDDIDYATNPNTIIHVINLTDIKGNMYDVTDDFRDKSIYIKSTKNGKYVSSDTDDASSTSTVAIANRDSVCSWEKFNVVTNYSTHSTKDIEISYGLSLKTRTGNYLSSYQSYDGAPLKNTVNNSYWECFRIFKNDNSYYLLSLINGKFVQVRDDNKLYSSATSNSTWEAFSIGINDTASMTVPALTSSNSYTIKASDGAKIRSGAGTGYSQVGAIAKGSIVNYSESVYANGYYWYRIDSINAMPGSWGSSYIGNWVANV